MEDLLGLAKLADARVTNKVYDDLLSKSARELGEHLQDWIKGIRFLTCPLQFLAVGQELLRKRLERVRDSVPNDDQVSPMPSIALPILNELVYQEEGNPIAELYMNLLKRAIDRNRTNEAHPAFTSIVRQICADEALLLSRIWEYRSKQAVWIGFPLVVHKDTFTEYGGDPQLRMHLSHLQSLNIIPPTRFLAPHEESSIGNLDWPPGDEAPDFRVYLVSFTEFGLLFCKACIPS